jgi:glycosyltransferase involved in cell wall biosynthesis
MNILLISKLPDLMLDTFIKPLQMVNSIDRIYVLRETASTLSYGNVVFLTDTPFKTYKKLRHFGKVLYAIKFCRRVKIDMIVSIMIYPHGYIAKLVSIFSNIPFSHITIAGHREFWLHGQVVERINLFLFRGARFITVTGERTKKYFTSNGFQANRVLKLPNIINVESFVDHKQLRCYDIISLSRLDSNKNISLLIQSIAKLKKDGFPFKVLIAGEGPERDNLMQEAIRLDVSSNIKFLGWVAQANIVKVYNTGKVYVMPSKGEGFPLSLLEAMLSGCVPIASNVGDISDIVIPEYNGILLSESPNIDELAEAIKYVMEDDERLDHLAQNAKKISSIMSVQSNTKIWNSAVKNIIQ